MSQVATPTGEEVLIPVWVVDHDSFRRWACSDEFPEYGRFSWLNNDVWVDVSMGKVIHGILKGQISAVLTLLAQHNAIGRYLPDGVLLTNAIIGLSTEPDGMFFFHKSLQSGAIRLKKGLDSLEVEGTPDMILEVISRSSVNKDTVILRDLYWQAGIAEYWLVDSRGEPTFNILRRTAKGYAAVRNQAGWLKSAVFGKSFRLTKQIDRTDNPDYRLEMR